MLPQVVCVAINRCWVCARIATRRYPNTVRIKPASLVGAASSAARLPARSPARPPACKITHWAHPLACNTPSCTPPPCRPRPVVLHSTPPLHTSPRPTHIPTDSLTSPHPPISTASSRAPLFRRCCCCYSHLLLMFEPPAPATLSHAVQSSFVATSSTHCHFKHPVCHASAAPLPQQMLLMQLLLLLHNSSAALQ